MNNVDKSDRPELSGNHNSSGKELAKTTNEKTKLAARHGSTIKLPPESTTSRTPIANTLKSRIKTSGNDLPPTARWLNEGANEGPWCYVSRMFLKAAHVNPPICVSTEDKKAKPIEEDMSSLSMKGRCGSAKEMGARNGRGPVVAPLTEIVRKASCGCRKAEANL